MPRLSPLTADNVSGELRSLYSAIEEKFGAVPNIFGTMAHAPGVLQAIVQLNQAIQGDLPAKFRELAYLKSSLCNNCDYCSHHHSRAAKAVGVSDAQIDSLADFEGSAAFDAQEKAVLRFAERLTQEADVDEETVNELKQFLSDSQLVVLAASVGLANFTNRFNHAFAIELP